MGIFYHVTTAQKKVILDQPDDNISANSGNIFSDGGQNMFPLAF